MPSESAYVTLISCDGFEFAVKRSCAVLSPAIQRMLDENAGFLESQTGRCYFENFNGMVLEKVCEYLYYHEKHKGELDVPEMDLPPELILELMMAADYLDI